ncbi:MAG: CRISPR-associated endonuclease Cas3'', partial [Candidatus Aminicenantes bacterium]|nr:CRISPR-associated endonuclease Cas3'' [Candidatus Aminicenantes bacterium]
MVNHFLAKSFPRETIAEHTKFLLDNYRRLQELMPHVKIDWELLRLAVKFHDLGKMNPKFQDKLYKILNLPPLPDSFPDEKEIPHGNLSAAFLDLKKLIERYGEADLKILYQSIYYHHPREV